MKIKVTEKCKRVCNNPVKTGDVVDVDANTARNLLKKGYVTAADDEAKNLDLEDASSVLTPAQAAQQVAEQVAAKEEAKEAAAEAKAAAKKH